LLIPTRNRDTRVRQAAVVTLDNVARHIIHVLCPAALCAGRAGWWLAGRSGGANGRAAAT
jgi:hypothetical protein